MCEILNSLSSPLSSQDPLSHMNPNTTITMINHPSQCGSYCAANHHGSYVYQQPSVCCGGGGYINTSASYCCSQPHAGVSYVAPPVDNSGGGNIVDVISARATILESEIEQINADLTATEGLLLRYGGPVYENSYQNLLCLRDQKKTQFWELLQELERLEELMAGASELVKAATSSTVMVDTKGRRINTTSGRR